MLLSAFWPLGVSFASDIIVNRSIVEALAASMPSPVMVAIAPVMSLNFT